MEIIEPKIGQTYETGKSPGDFRQWLGIHPETWVATDYYNKLHALVVNLTRARQAEISLDQFRKILKSFKTYREYLVLMVQAYNAEQQERFKDGRRVKPAIPVEIDVVEALIPPGSPAEKVAQFTDQLKTFADQTQIDLDQLRKLLLENGQRLITDIFGQQTGQERGDWVREIEHVITL